MEEILPILAFGWLGMVGIASSLKWLSRYLLTHSTKGSSKILRCAEQYYQLSDFIVTYMAGVVPILLVIGYPLIFCTDLGLEWKLFLGYLLTGGGFNILILVSRGYSEDVQEKAGNIGLAIVCCYLIPVLCYLFYWFWYYLCGGGLVVEVAETFLEKVMYGGITLIGIVFWVGLILIILGKM